MRQIENSNGNCGGADSLYAHSLPDVGLACWQTLDSHLLEVARLSRQFAEPFSSGAMAESIGLLHDAGKARKSFQDYLKLQNGIELDDADYGNHSHSGAGACWACQNVKPVGKFMAYVIAGHHAGLADWSSADGAGDSALENRLAHDAPTLEEPAVRHFVDELQTRLETPLSAPWKGFKPADVSFWVRMLYSCLVDADFLDTEAFLDPERSSLRGPDKELTELARSFFSKLDEKQRKSSSTEVNAIRSEVRAACEAAAECSPGLFSLTVPTGGGKTLSSTAFAFRHALKYGLKRIVYVIPYTSIIEQTTEVLRSFVGDENVLEHHSNLDPDKETRKSRLASENWDAPVVVTTAVQFFESLYANKSSRCRKLHNIAESVVILDEAQLLPARLLKPISEAIRQLSVHYRTTLVLSTATQPALPLEGVREIIPETLNLYRRLKRTEIELPEDRTRRREWSDLAEELATHDQVLCILNTRRDARALFDFMPEGTIHLSASMCGEHRSRVISEIRNRLARGEKTRVVSTQLIEAGVDVDFPVVYRAFTGLPSIVQSAGRCNREGRHAKGRVVVFMPPKPAPSGDLRWYEDSFIDQLAGTSQFDFDSPEIYPQFFAHYYNAQHEIGESILALLNASAQYGNIQFAAAARAFKMIDGSGQVGVIVRYGDSERWISALQAVGPKRAIMRKLQRYTVTVPRWLFEKQMAAGGYREVGKEGGIYVQEQVSLYSETYGLDQEWEGLSDDQYII